MKKRQQPEIKAGSQLIISDLIRLVSENEYEGQIAGIGLLSQPDMGTLQYCSVEVGSPEQEDAELYYFTNEWEDIVDLEKFQELEKIFLGLHPEKSDLSELEMEFGLFLDDCCLATLDEVKKQKLSKIDPNALYIYSRLDCSDEEYVEWFTETNSSDHLETLIGLIGGDASVASVQSPPTPAPQTSDSPPEEQGPRRAFNESELDFIAASSCGKLAAVESLNDGMRDLVRAEALVMAARTGRDEVCHFLLEQGVPKDYRGYRGKTAYEFAKQEERTKVVELLDSAPDSSTAKQIEKRPATTDEDLLWILQVKIPSDRRKSKK